MKWHWMIWNSHLEVGRCGVNLLAELSQMRSQEFFAGWLLTQPGVRAGEVMYDYLIQFRWCKHFIGKTKD